MHINYEELTINHRDKSFILNKHMLDRQIAWENLDLIKSLHIERVELEFMMNQTDDPGELKFLFAFWQENQFELQDAWKFDRDARFHRFWTVPKCECPRMDNEDQYASGYSVINCGCPIHGE